MRLIGTIAQIWLVAVAVVVIACLLYVLLDRLDRTRERLRLWLFKRLVVTRAPAKETHAADFDEWERELRAEAEET